MDTRRGKYRRWAYVYFDPFDIEVEIVRVVNTADKLSTHLKTVKKSGSRNVDGEIQVERRRRDLRLRRVFREARRMRKQPNSLRFRLSS